MGKIELRTYSKANFEVKPLFALHVSLLLSHMNTMVICASTMSDFMLLSPRNARDAQKMTQVRPHEIFVSLLILRDTAWLLHRFSIDEETFPVSSHLRKKANQDSFLPK